MFAPHSPQVQSSEIRSAHIAVSSCQFIAFDFDGVFSDAIEHHVDVANSLLPRFGIDRQGTVKTVQNLSNVRWSTFGEAMGLTPEAARKYEEAACEILLADQHRSDFFPGMAEGLRELAKSGRQIVIISNNVSDNVRRSLHYYGVCEYVKEIYGIPDSRTKGARLQHAMETFGFRPNQSVIIGDSSSDIRAGHEAGTYTIAVSWGVQKYSSLVEVKPDFLVHTSRELFNLLEGRRPVRGPSPRFFDRNITS